MLKIFLIVILYTTTLHQWFPCFPILKQIIYFILHQIGPLLQTYAPWILREKQEILQPIVVCENNQRSGLTSTFQSVDVHVALIFFKYRCEFILS